MSNEARYRGAWGGVDAAFKRSAIDGTPKLAWGQYVSSVSASPGAVAYGAPGWGDRAQLGSAAADMLLHNPTVAAIAQASTALVIGESLRLSSKPCAATLGISEEEAAALGDRLEKAFKEWGENPRAFDLSGRMTLSEMVLAAYWHWLAWGEILLECSAARDPSTDFLTKISLLDSRMIASDRFLFGATNMDERTVQGVCFGARGRFKGLWLYRFAPGVAQMAAAEYFDAFTPWGRTKLALIFMPVAPSAVRGQAVLSSVLGSAQDRQALSEVTVSGHAAQSLVAATLTSPLPPDLAAGALELSPNAGENPVTAMMNYRLQWHEQAQSRLTLSPNAGISMLAPGEELKLVSPGGPTRDYLDFDKSLARSACSALGLPYELVFSDLAGASFSSARLGVQLPYRNSLRIRKHTVGRMLRTIFEAWCEEAVRRSLVELPRNCKPWSNATKAAFCKCDVLGPGMPTPNPADTVEAAIAAISANLSTFESECAGFGVDFSEILKQRKLENDALRESGLPVPGEAPKAGASEPDGDEGEVEDEEAEGEEDEDEGEGPSFPGYRFRDSDQGGGGVTPGQR